jgi:amino acid transporter
LLHAGAPLQHLTAVRGHRLRRRRPSPRRGTTKRVNMQQKSEPRTGLGTFAGVFTPSILTIIGLILFLRLGYVVGSSGLTRALQIILLANLISVLTTFSVSAIATNFKVKGGGDYFLISRTLGLGFGGAIGIVLFLAQSVSIGFYCVGFGEAVAALLPVHSHLLAQVIAAGAVLALFRLAWLGADLATRFQYVVMGTLVAAILVFAAGAIGHWDHSVLAANLQAPDNAQAFWVMFALFFPAVTGFTQGVSMSGDLRDASKSIPLGTFLAVALSIVIYAGAAVLFAASEPLSNLASDYGAMRRVATGGWLIDLGVIAATLSSALASFLGAPRILQSLAADRIFPLLRPFAHGVGAASNPRRGVLLSGAIALAVVALGNLNAIAPVVSMFFLVSYGLVNYATYFEATAASPSFRPTFRWYHRHLSLAGVLVCAGVALAIDVWSALIAMGILLAIFQYLKVKGVPARWADSRRSYHLKQVRDNLLAAAREAEHPRDWRPHILAFSDNPGRRLRLAQFASWVEGGSGTTTVVRVLEGEGPEMLARREQTLEALTRELKEADAKVFPLVVSAPSFQSALELLVQAVGTGPIRVNTVLANWFEGPPGLVSQWASERYGRRLRTAFRAGCNLLILDANEAEWAALEQVAPRKRVIDVWWRGEQTGQLMVLLAYQMTRSDEWRDAKIRVLLPVQGPSADTALRDVDRMLDEARIDARAVAVQDAGSAAIVEHSARTSIVFIGFEIRGGRIIDPFGNDVAGILGELPPVVLAMAAHDVDLDAQPDEGGAAEKAALRDRLEDAARTLEKAQRAEKDAAEALLKAETALLEAQAREAEPEALDKLRTQAETARATAAQTQQAVPVAVAEQQAAEAAAREQGIELPSSGKQGGQ